MAGDWIPYQKGLSRKREVGAIARQTGRSRHEVVGVLLEFWDWVDSESTDGILQATSLEDLPNLIPGSDLVFWQAVVEVGWLGVGFAPGRRRKLEANVTIGTPRLVIPNFSRWLGNSSKRRLNDVIHKRASRKDVTANVRKPSATSPPVVGRPSAFAVDERGTRVEESRVEYRRGEKNVSPQPPKNTAAENAGGEAKADGDEESQPRAPFDLTPPGLAQAFCFYSSRRRGGKCADQTSDVAISIAELIRLGHAPEKIYAAIVDPDRDREWWWSQLRDEIVPRPVPRKPSIAEMLEDIRREDGTYQSPN